MLSPLISPSHPPPPPSPPVPALLFLFVFGESNLQDRDYTIPSLPIELQGIRLTCIQTAQGDKRAGGSRLWRLSLMQVQRARPLRSSVGSLDPSIHPHLPSLRRAKAKVAPATTVHVPRLYAYAFASLPVPTRF